MEYNLYFNLQTRKLEVFKLPTIVVGDNNSNIIIIKTPVEYQGIWLYGTNLVVNYETTWVDKNGNISKGQVDITNTCQEKGEYLYYTWVLDQRQTLKIGQCKFSLDFLMNLEEDPSANNARYYLALETDSETNKQSVQIAKDENFLDVETKYWSLSSLSTSINIGDNGMIAGEVAETSDNTGDFIVDQVYNPTSTNAQSGVAVAGAIAQLEVGSGGTSDYEKLNNKPSINGVELSGNKTLKELGINLPNMDDYYTKDEVDSLVGDIETLLGGI